jgi:LmbE family N-acetylglucosaminyl deacetylase
VGRVVEAIWRGGFRVSALGARPSVRLWSSEGGLEVVAVSPHPDDETIACGGTLALHASAGDRVTAIFVTDGRRSRAFGLGPEEMARRRRSEADAAARALGIRALWLGFPEGAWTPQELIAAATPPLAAADLVYAPSLVDFHPEHLRVASTLAQLLGRGAAPRARVRVYQTQVPLTRLLVNVVAPVGPASAELEAALAAYATQAGNCGRALRQRRYAAAYHGLDSLAEELWEMDAARYARLNASSPRPPARFRGVRSFPLTDPLAYLSGRAARRALADEA